MNSKRKQLLILAALAYAMAGAVCWAQVKSTRVGSIKTVTCAIDAATATTIFSANLSRMSWWIVNPSSSTADVRIGFASATNTLTSTNSFVLSGGQGLADGYPSVFIGDIKCTTTSGATQALQVGELLQ